LSKRARRILVVVAIAAPIVLVGGAFVAAEATKSNTFCGTSCHEMEPYYHTWQASSHAEVDCVRCHIPPGFWNYAKTKLFGLRELWVHITSQVEKPIAVTRHISNQVCTGCHDSPEMRGPVRLARWTEDFTHTGHSQVPNCIDCHARVVHPDIPGVLATPPRTMEACFTCHDGTSQPDDCVYCHATSPHPDRGACDQCHGLRSWSGDFPHPDPLTGRHEEILCERCHARATATDIGPTVACLDCHKPPHPFQLGRLNLRRCTECHVITHWKPNTFDHPASDCISCHGNEHGSSQLTQCQQCHSQTTWAGAKHPNSDCTACHSNQHGSPRFTQCQQCHSQTTWAGAKHPNSDCTACHTAGRLHSGLSSTCQNCHVSGAYWVPSTFNHPQVGEHIPSGEHRLSCTECHKTTYASATCTPCHGPGGPGGD
jgi:nitrate/TMAO reductase-like tetraheme cytochrome c subunit